MRLTWRLLSEDGSPLLPGSMDGTEKFWTAFGEMGLNLGEEATEHLGHRGRAILGQ